MIKVLIGIVLFVLGSCWLSLVIAIGVSVGIKDQLKNLENINKKK